MEKLKYLYSYDFLFYINRVRLETADYVFAGIAAGLVGLAIVLRVVSWKNKHVVCKKLLMRWYRMSLTIGLLGIVWCGARYEYIRWFGTHTAFLILLVIGLVWTGYIVRYWLAGYRVEKTAWEKQQLKQKYL